MKAPQIIIIVMLSISVFISVMKHGEPRDGKHSALTAIVAAAIQVALLWWGGFFS